MYHEQLSQRNNASRLAHLGIATLATLAMQAGTSEAHSTTPMGAGEIIGLGDYPTDAESDLISKSFAIADRYAQQVRPDVAASPNCRVNGDPTTSTLTYSMLSTAEMNRLTVDSGDTVETDQTVAAYAYVALCHIAFNRDYLAEQRDDTKCAVIVHEKWHIGGAEHEDPEMSSDGNFSPMRYSALEDRAVADVVPECSDAFDKTKTKYTDKQIIKMSLGETNETVGACKSKKSPKSITSFYCSAYRKAKPKSQQKLRHYMIRIQDNHLNEDGITQTETTTIKKKTFQRNWKVSKPLKKVSYSGIATPAESSTR